MRMRKLQISELAENISSLTLLDKEWLIGLLSKYLNKETAREGPEVLRLLEQLKLRNLI